MEQLKSRNVKEFDNNNKLGKGNTKMAMKLGDFNQQLTW